jgi:hypothetical protein
VIPLFAVTVEVVDTVFVSVGLPAAVDAKYDDVITLNKELLMRSDIVVCDSIVANADGLTD